MAIKPDALLEFARTISGSNSQQSQQKLARVTRIDDGVVYVSIPGGVDETPIAATGAELSVGDTVAVSVESGQLRASTNISAPSVSAGVVKSAVSTVGKAVQAVKQATDEAAKVAGAINQHFWSDGNGIHVTEAEHDATTEHNILINSLGILLRKAENYLVSITASAIAFYDGAGTAASNIVASFGASRAQVGKDAAAHIVIEGDGLKLYDETGTDYSQIQTTESTAPGVSPAYGIKITASDGEVLLSIDPLLNAAGTDWDGSVLSIKEIVTSGDIYCGGTIHQNS